MQEIIKQFFQDSIETKQKVIETLLPEIEKSTQILIEALKNNKKVIIAGNGGSAADAQHMAAELIVRYEKDRPSLPAIALTTDTSIITACANDYGYDQLFERQIQGLGNEGDVFIAISTSGNSPNILKAIEMSKQKNMKVIVLSGKDGGQMKDLGNSNIIIPSMVTGRIQESHEVIIHTWCKLIEENIFP